MANGLTEDAHRLAHKLQGCAWELISENFENQIFDWGTLGRLKENILNEYFPKVARDRSAKCDDRMMDYSGSVVHAQLGYASVWAGHAAWVGSLFINKPNVSLLHPCGDKVTETTRLCDERLYTSGFLPALTSPINLNLVAEPLKAHRIERDWNRGSYAETAVNLLRAMELNLNIKTALTYGDTYFLEILWPRTVTRWVQDPLLGFPRPDPDTPPLSPVPRKDGDVHCVIIGMSASGGCFLTPYILANLDDVKITAIDGSRSRESMFVPLKYEWVRDNRFEFLEMKTDDYFTDVFDGHTQEIDMVIIEYALEMDYLVHEFIMFWQILRPGGVILGRNFNFHHEGVMLGVFQAAENWGVTPRLTADGCWFFIKPYDDAVKAHENV